VSSLHGDIQKGKGFFIMKKLTALLLSL